MKQHFSEADLLETYYMQPGQSLPVMMHLADCGECAARYERLDRKMRSLTACEHDKPESFWARQRMLVMRRIDAQRSRTSSISRVSRIAAAAALIFLLGGGIVTWKENSNTQRLESATSRASQSVAPATTEPVTIEVAETSDPWQSEELNEFQSVVDWETWVEPSKGDKAL